MRCVAFRFRHLAPAVFCLAVTAFPGNASAIDEQSSVATPAAAPDAPVTESKAGSEQESRSPRTRQSLGTAVAPTSELASRGSQAFIYGLTAFFIGIAFYKKFGERAIAKLNRDESIVIVAKKQLTPKHQLFLVRVHGKELLLGAADSVSTIATFDLQNGSSPFDQELLSALHHREFQGNAGLTADGTLPAETLRTTEAPGKRRAAG